MGTPAFAVTVLEALLGWEPGEVVAVYTRPDRPSGRGRKVLPTPVKTLALSRDIPVLQPRDFKDEATVRELADFAPDFLAVAAYGVLLPQAVLDVPKFPVLNVHASLLPRYRGAAPMQRAIMEGWRPGDVTGVSIMEIVLQLDSGPVHAARSVPLAGQTARTLHDALADIGGRLLVDVMEAMLQGRAKATPQDGALATYAERILPSDRDVRWDRETLAVDAHIRAMSPAPGARTVFRIEGGQSIPCLVRPGRPVSVGDPAVPWTGDIPPGTLRRAGSRLFVACADGWYELTVLRPEGGRDMATGDFCNGRLRGAASGVCGMAASA
jgi:methionyl-tRNA formyltransferase